jgi:AAA15 family ATPase/GTPase
MSLHRGGDGNIQFALPFSEESDGTQQLLHYLPYLLPKQGRSRVVVIDELDRSLHPKLCWELVDFFSKSCPGVRRQMIVTTHEAHLLDQDLLRRDEYWMVEKDKTGQSRLTPLTDFNVRKDLNLRKGYLQGRFDALPIIGDISSLASWLGCTTEGAKEDAQKEPSA